MPKLFDYAVTQFGLAPEAGIQWWQATALLHAGRPAGLPDSATPTEVRSYAETQGLGAYTPPVVPFPLTPTVAALIWWSPLSQPQRELSQLLHLRYPPSHPVQVVTSEQTHGPISLSLAELASLANSTEATSVLYLPPLAITADQRGADGLRWVLARLLGPGGCPWDVRQRPRDLRGALLEEVHEVIEALEANDQIGLREELGDLLLAVFAQSEMARQAGHFALEDVFAEISAKLVRRHPHVFGSRAVDGAASIPQHWEAIKNAELTAKGRSRTSPLDGIPPDLPALATAQTLAKKASRTGFAWQADAEVWAKVEEELAELHEALANQDRDHANEELGDVLFTLTSLADWHKLDAEVALRDVNRKFRRRFAALEDLVAASGRTIAEHSLDELLALWTLTKRAG